MDHIGENAELYALGVLNENERSKIEQHARYCTPCMKLLGNAERIVSDVESEMPTIDPPYQLEERVLRSARALEKVRQLRPNRNWGSLAALLVVGVASTIMGFQVWNLDRHLRENDAIVAVLAHGEFGQLSFRTQPSTEPIAKAMCEKDGKWIYLIVAEPNSNLTLYGERNGKLEKLGNPVSQGQSATLFVEGPGKFSALELIANGRFVAKAKTNYPR